MKQGRSLECTKKQMNFDIMMFLLEVNHHQQKWWETFWMMINLTNMLIRNGETQQPNRTKRWWPVGLPGVRTPYVHKYHICFETLDKIGTNTLRGTNIFPF